jgi:hypothetical protein
MSLYLHGLLVLLRVFWCPEEDVELFIFPFSYSYLFLFKNIKVVPKAVLVLLI